MSANGRNSCSMVEIKEKIFKSYDIRGVYPSEIDEEGVFKISKLIAEKIFKKGAIVVAHDARTSSPSLYKKVVAGIKKAEGDFRIIDIGVATTPMFYFLGVELGVSGGIMVTASHNPKEYNGLKVVGAGAKMIGGKEILKLFNV